MLKQMVFQLEEDLKIRLKEIALKERRTLTSLVNKILSDFCGGYKNGN